MLLSDIAIRRPVFTAMVCIALMTLGLMSYKRLGVDLFPDVSFPIVSVSTPYPGAGPGEVESLVTKPIEDAVASINGVDEVRSFSRDSVSVVIVQFKLDVDVKLAAADVREKIAGIRRNLPDGIDEPVVGRIDPSALPILTYAVAADGVPSDQIRRTVEDVIKPQIESIDGVAALEIIGGLEREVQVELDLQRLEAVGLSPVQVAQQIGSESLDLPGGRVDRGATELSVRTVGRFRSADEVGEIVLKNDGGTLIRVRDVANVIDGYKEVRTRTSLDGKDSVTFQIKKQSGTNTVAICDNVYKALGRLQSGGLPSTYSIKKIVDGSEFIRKNQADVNEALWFGGGMAILVIFFFMLDWRSTFISATALPTSVITTFLVMDMLGFTLNQMTLLALSLAIGLLIDDAVVVRENIHRHMEMGKDPMTAARDGTAQIGLAVMATTFTIVAVFVPVAFMGGMVGKFFREFGLTVAAAVMVSLFVSFTLDPMLSSRMVKAHDPHAKERAYATPVLGSILRGYDKLDAAYRDVLAWALSHRKTVVFASFAVFVGTMMLVGLMGKEFFSKADRGEFQVSVELPPGTSFVESERFGRELEKTIRETSPEIRSIFTTVGPGEEVNKLTFRVYTTAFDERPVTQLQIMDGLRERFAQIPAAKIAVEDIAFIEGANEAPITLLVRGTDAKVLDDLASRVFGAVRSTAGVVDARMLSSPGKPELSVKVDRTRAGDLGLTTGGVAMAVRASLEGDAVAKLRAGDKDVDVRVRLRPQDREDPARLGTLTLPSKSGRLVHLSEVAQIERETGPSVIERDQRQRLVTVAASLSGRSLGEITADIQAKLDTMKMPPGYSAKFKGEAERMQETFNNMLLALGVAVLFIYFCLASQYESLVHPMTIMVSLPLAIVGALLLLFLTGRPLGMPAMIGIVLLMGLVTKNAILLVDYTNELREQGKGILEALLEAGPTRLRPILMTSSAAILGMLPLATSRGPGSEFRVPMAVAVIGGLIASTLLTLVVVPVVYVWMDKFTLRGRREAKAAKLRAAEETTDAGGGQLAV